MHMFVLAGGFGTRLRSVVNKVPKALAPINGVPMLSLQIAHWVKQGQQSFIFLLHHEASQIIALLKRLQDEYGASVSFDWVVEAEPLGTGGAVANAIRERSITKSILITNADTWLGASLHSLSNIESAAMGILEVRDTSRYGSVVLDEDGHVSEFFEKASGQTVVSGGLINAGLYKLPTDIFLGFNAKNFSIEMDLLPFYIKNTTLHGVIINGEFFDIGIPADYQNFCEWYREKNAKI